MQAGVAGTVLSSSAEDDSSDEKRLGESGCRAGGDLGLGVTEAWERQGRAELGGLPPSGQYAGHSRAQASSWLAAQCLILDNESM